MLTTLVDVVVMYVLLGLVGWCALAPLDAARRGRLLVAAPVFGAALVAAVASTATRWLAMPATLVVVGVVLIALVVVGAVRGRLGVRHERATLIGVVAAPVLTIAGVAVCLLPTAWAGDSRPASATVIVDQFYFTSNASYLTDHPMLPGPYWNAEDWAGSATPSFGPVVDVISNRLRYGQSSVSSALSVVLHREPSDLVMSVSILWLVLIGVAAFTAATLLGARRRWALGAVPVVTGSLYVTSQVLEGKNDGLLGVSAGLLAVGLSFAASRTPGLVWPLALSVAGLAATYSELVLVLVAPVALIAIVGPRAHLLARLNTLGGAWALGAVLTPWAWIWLAQSARIGGRYSEGNGPWTFRDGVPVLRAAIGIEPFSPDGSWAALNTVLALVGLVAVIVGLIAAVAWSPARGAAIGVVVALVALEVTGIRAGAGNLQYRTAQLGAAFILVLAVVGWDALGRRLVRSRVRARVRPVAAVGIGLALVFTAGNVATAAAHLPRERAEVQHVPQDDLAEVTAWVEEIDGADLAVVVPRFTDLLWLSLSLRDVDDVAYPVIPAVYLGSFPHWDREPDRYYVVGVGATLAGEATVLQRNDRYQLVELGDTGMILTPFQPTFYWSRTTFMRGFPCVRDGAQMLLLRGSTAPQTFSVGSLAKSPVAANLRLTINGEEVPRAATPADVDGWNVQTFRAPKFRSAIIDISSTTAARRAGTTALPLVFGGEDLAQDLIKPDVDLTEFCLADSTDPADAYLDGYDRDLTTLQRD